MTLLSDSDLDSVFAQLLTREASKARLQRTLAVMKKEIRRRRDVAAALPGTPPPALDCAAAAAAATTAPPRPARPFPFVQLMVQGWTGTIAKTVTAPLERAKLVLQTQAMEPRVVSGDIAPYTGFFDCVYRSVTGVDRDAGVFARVCGVASLWRGNVSNCVRFFPVACCNIMVRDKITNVFPQYSQETDIVKYRAMQILSGSITAAISNAVVYPLICSHTILGSDLGKTRAFSGTWGCIASIVRHNGVGALFSGLAASTAGIVLYRATHFMFKNVLRRITPYQNEFSMRSISTKFVVAQLAVSMGGICAYPCDTVQRRLMVQATSWERKYKPLKESKTQQLTRRFIGVFQPENVLLCVCFLD